MLEEDELIVINELGQKYETQNKRSNRKYKITKALARTILLQKYAGSALMQKILQLIRKIWVNYELQENWRETIFFYRYIREKIWRCVEIIV